MSQRFPAVYFLNSHTNRKPVEQLSNWVLGPRKKDGGKWESKANYANTRHFCSGSTRALITTDVLGRGVDIPDATWRAQKHCKSSKLI